MDLIKYFKYKKLFLWCVFYSILLSSLVGQYNEYTKMHGMSNIKLANAQQANAAHNYKNTRNKL
jgi:hypothetical protein